MREIKRIRTRLKVLRDRIEELEAAIQKSTPTYNSTKTKSINSDRENKIVKLIDLKNTYALTVSEYEQKVFEFLKAIKDLPEVQYKILYYRYVKGLKWSEVSNKVHYTRQHCRRLVVNVLEKLQNSKDVTKCYTSLC